MASWIVERTQDRRFPFRITIEQEGRLLLAVRAQSRWPGAGSQIFCLRETELDLLRARFPEAGEPRLRRCLNQLRAEGRLRCEGRGRAARWVRIEKSGGRAV